MDIPAVNVSLNTTQEEFVITGVSRKCRKGHLNPCDIEW